MYRKSVHDDPMVRTYLALSMGQSGKSKFGSILMEGLEDENSSSRFERPTNCEIGALVRNSDNNALATSCPLKLFSPIFLLRLA